MTHQYIRRITNHHLSVVPGLLENRLHDSVSITTLQEGNFFYLLFCFLWLWSCFPSFSLPYCSYVGKRTCLMGEPLNRLLFNDAEPDALWTFHCQFEFPSILFNADRGVPGRRSARKYEKGKQIGWWMFQSWFQPNAQEQDLSDSESFIHNLNPPLKRASNDQLCATQSSRGFWHTRLLIGGQYMEVSRLTENTFGQINAPFWLSVSISSTITSN